MNCHGRGFLSSNRGNSAEKQGIHAYPARLATERVIALFLGESNRGIPAPEDPHLKTRT
jgi:hypothetical protein